MATHLKGKGLKRKPGGALRRLRPVFTPLDAPPARMKRETGRVSGAALRGTFFKTFWVGLGVRGKRGNREGKQCRVFAGFKAGWVHGASHSQSLPGRAVKCVKVR